MTLKYVQHEAGYTLVEALVAIGILTSILMGVTLLAIQSIRATNVTQAKLQAEYLAGEGIELARVMRDAGVGFFQTSYTDAVAAAGTGSIALNIDALGHVCLPSTSCASTPLFQDSGQHNLFVTQCDTSQQNTTCARSSFTRIITLHPSSDGSHVTVESRVQYAVNGFANPLTYTLTTELYHVAQ
jgi:type II secretory pathway pseudopilin PulG